MWRFPDEEDGRGSDYDCVSDNDNNIDVCGKDHHRNPVVQIICLCLVASVMECYLTSCLAFLKLGRSVPAMYSMHFTEALSFDHIPAASVPIFSTNFVVTPSYRPLLTSLPNALISDYEYGSVSGVDEGGTCSNGDKFIFHLSPFLHRLLVFGLDGFDDGFVHARIMLFRYSSIMSSICFFVIVGLKRSIYDRSSNASVVPPRY